MTPFNLAKKIAALALGQFKEGFSKDNKIVELKPAGPVRGNVLFSYIIDPFLLKAGQVVSIAHTHDWESLQMARTFLDLGYSVDVISYRNRDFVPRKEYTLFIDVRRNLERLAPLLNRDCIKVMHIDAANILFHDTAELNRLLALQQRRGTTLRPKRYEMPNLAIEHADCATILGNEFTMSTFSFAGKPLFRIPISSPVLFPEPTDKVMDSSRSRFLWFGSTGLVHKGLDLVLEAFSEMPEYELFVCGPIHQEEDFQRAYAKELFQTPNIHTVGWVDVASQKFRDLVDSCVALVYPSCSEGGGGSVITCLHAGLIPLVSYESSVDISPDFGLIFRESSVDEIQRCVRRIASLDSRALIRMARKAWEFARSHHTRDRFAEEYRRVATRILAGPRELERPNLPPSQLVQHSFPS